MAGSRIGGMAGGGSSGQKQTILLFYLAIKHMPGISKDSINE
jgi:hypothetical protein